MRIDKYRISSHAAKRMAQRNLDLGDVALALRLGRKLHREGLEFFFLGERDLPRVCKRVRRRLAGLTVVAADHCVLTVYRHEKALARIKRKLKWHWPLCRPHEAMSASVA